MLSGVPRRAVAGDRCVAPPSRACFSCWCKPTRAPTWTAVPPTPMGMAARLTVPHHGAAASLTTPTSPRTQCAARAVGADLAPFHIPNATRRAGHRGGRAPVHLRLEADATGALPRGGSVTTARGITGTTVTDGCLNETNAATRKHARPHRRRRRRPHPCRRPRRMLTSFPVLNSLARPAPHPAVTKLL